jgi:hypothetical protein
VKEGADHPAIDITVRNESTRTISGRVVMPSDNAGAAAAVPANLTFFLVPRDPNALADSGAPTYSNTAPDRSSGRFEIRALPPGAYDLIVSAQAPQAPAPRGQGSLPLRLMGRARIDIADRDIDDVTITIQPGVEVRARLLIDGKPPAPLPRWMIDGPGAGDDPIPTAPSVRLILQSRENYPRPFEDAARNSTYDPAEGFLFRGVPEGRFDFQLGPQSGEALSGNAYIADVREDGASILDEGLTLNGRTPGMIEVQVSTRGERITGTVRDAEQKTIAAARVALAPAQSRRQNLALFKTTVSDAAGNFTIEGIAPGEYKLFAWENAPNNAHLNSEFLANHELRGHAVTVKAGVPVKMDLQAIGQDKRP